MVLRLICVRVENGISHRHDAFSRTILSFSPRASFLPTISAMTPNRKTAISFFVASSMQYLLVFLKTGTAKGRHTSPQKHGRERLTGAGSHG